ncbi:MAG: class I SAM-dependent RNA methyltransferase [Hyphomicrobiales bacterium]|nr:class I SAM-dependent RNA methyltransferase [Hyphomicrobiales bacterium]
MTEILTIDALGHQGDGLVQTSDGRIFIPFALAGELVEVTNSSARRDLVNVVEPSSDRVEPICRHFGTCGGCQVQHLANEPYLAWKKKLVEDALISQNINAKVEPVVSFSNDRRRRVVFSATHTSTGILLGFTQKSTHHITDISECPVIRRSIASQLETIRKAIRPILPARGITSICVVDCDNGLDIHLEAQGKLGEKARQSAIRIALEGDIARLSYGGEVLIETRRPELTMGLANVGMPPGSFIQAVASAETRMAAMVCDHLKSCKQVADLYCGIGTFAFRLAENSTILACENNQLALDALDEAWRATGGKLKLVRTEKRDLSLRPVMVEELKKIQGVVFDPPRAGARAQVQQLARSKVKKIAAVSCNPVSLAQDLGVLINGGFKIVSVTPIDQFVFTPHVEVVALLQR